MTSLRKTRCFVKAVTLVAAISWVVASNHCALGAMKVAMKGGHACCHKELPATLPSTECCEAFNIPLPDQIAVPAAQLHELKPVWNADANVLAPLPAVTIFAEFATGPPRDVSPIRLVLSRCQPAHAPPLFVV